MNWQEFIERILQSCSKDGLCEYCDFYDAEKKGCVFEERPVLWRRMIEKLKALRDREIELSITTGDMEEAEYYQGMADGIQTALVLLEEVE